MDIYKQRSTWKIILAVAGGAILLITLLYSNYLAKRLAENEKRNVELFVEAIKTIPEGDLLMDQSLPLTLVENINNIPVVLESEEGDLQGWNYSDTLTSDQSFLREEKEKYLKKGLEPILGPPGYANKIYYKNSRLYQLITYFPLVQALMVLLFIGLGYYLFNSTRRAEQNRVWVGMAKETAHQLGTPISAILAWIEHLKISDELTYSQSEIVQELGYDVNRLELIADRFSKIGSAPDLQKTSLSSELKKCQDYMSKRTPSLIVLDFEEATNKDLEVMINRHLFDWVMENLIRNALDSMDGKGSISASTYLENDYVCIDIEDTGKGIQPSKFKTVFMPGYSTKKRGWGLGLSLSKRIIEDYHKGKIFVKHSKVNEGTCFTIKLPRVS